MIFWKLFWVFCKIGIVNFGGGYAMISLIQSEVVVHHHWLSSEQFTDIVAISQMTPGPIGINVATYVGYTAVLEQGHSVILAVLGAILASFAVILLPFILMLFLGYLFRRYKDNRVMKTTFGILRPIVIGLIASAALILMTKANFSSIEENTLLFVMNVLLCLVALLAVYRYKKNPLKVIAFAGIIGLSIYPILV